MIKHFPLPDAGEGLTEAEILGWRVSPGDEVSVNQIIVEIETAKAAVELPCPWAGTVSELLVDPGTTVEVGTPIVAVELAGDAAAADSGAAATTGEGDGSVATLVGYGPRAGSTKRRPRKRTAAASTTPVNAGPVSEGPASNTPASSATASSATESAGTPVVGAPADVPMPSGGANGTIAAADGSGGNTQTAPAPSGGTVPLAKPPVRKLAKDLGVDLRELVGSGSGGVVTRADVEAAAEPGVDTAAGAGAPGTTAPDTTGAPSNGNADRETRVPIKGVRRATARAMVDSAFTAPHVTEFLTVDVTELMRLRDRLRTQPRLQDVKVTPLAFAAKAMCLAMQRTPDVNATWDEQAGEIVYKHYVHLGIAAATPRGLVVPKVRDADQMSLAELAGQVRDLTETARQGRTAPEDMLNGTMTITNVGVFGVDTGTPILNPGESAILALGAVREMPWVVDGQVVPRQVCQLALSFDHRVVDGQQGSQFLADVGALLSDPGVAFTY